MTRTGHHLPAYPDLAGELKKSYHLEMIADRSRVDAVSAALRRTLKPEHIFCEAGCGTGIFAIEAAGICKRVYAVELDSTMAEIAQANIRLAGLEDRIQLIVGNALSVRLPEKVDLALCETVSVWAVEEPLVPIANRIRAEVLKPGGRMLPLRVVNCAELANYRFTYNGVTMKAVIPLFTGVRQPNAMTEKKVCRTLDFSGRVETGLGAEVEFETVADGVINCAVLTSIVQVGPDVVFSGSDTFVPPTVVPLKEDVRVKTGDRLRFRAALRARSALESGLFEVEVV